MSDFGFSMPRYFQNMPEIGKDLVEVKEDNAAELKQVEKEVHDAIEAATQAGKSDDAIDPCGRSAHADGPDQRSGRSGNLVSVKQPL